MKPGNMFPYRHGTAISTTLLDPSLVAKYDYLLLLDTLLESGYPLCFSQWLPWLMLFLKRRYFYS